MVSRERRHWTQALAPNRGVPRRSPARQPTEHQRIRLSYAMLVGLWLAAALAANRDEADAVIGDRRGCARQAGHD